MPFCGFYWTEWANEHFSDREDDGECLRFSNAYLLHVNIIIDKGESGNIEDSTILFIEAPV